MFKQPIHFTKFILLSVFVSSTFVACKREINSLAVGDSNSLAAGAVISEKNNSPAAQIAASEKLEIPAAIALPDNLPNGNTRVATFYAEGVQKYKAQIKAGSDPIVYEWVFVAPQADLYDATNAKVGTHSAGPTWQLSVMDSIYGQQYSPPKSAPSPDAGSIDWLLLKPKTGTVPTGIFANVAYIQRIATKGGKAPTTPPTSANKTVEVKYKAVYRFTKINP
ncbi:MAG TPA: DUF3455 domain-containing protein [Chitinophagaceae bacterium]|jgi:hypothetical protein|nr:DUF3455 domain-containing protein [Chitinophagaceae bacterium]